MAATFSTINLTQPVLPVLREEFEVDAAKAPLSVSAVIFGIALVAVLRVIPVAAGILEARLDRPGNA